MTEHDKFIKEAIRLANDNVLEHNGKPFGAVITREGKVIATGTNNVIALNDPTAHAEMQALRKASQVLSSDSLTECIVYASGHPCPMCLAACYLAGITQIFYYGSLEEETLAGFDVQNVYKEIGKANLERHYPLVQLRVSDVKDPFNTWKEKGVN